MAIPALKLPCMDINVIPSSDGQLRIENTELESKIKCHTGDDERDGSLIQEKNHKQVN